MPAAELPAFLRVPVGRLVRSLAPTRIVLFGSYAAGSARAGSDVDLLVITAAPGDPEAARRRARQLLAASFPPIDVVICTPDEAGEAADARSPFLESILENGVMVYERP